MKRIKWGNALIYMDLLHFTLDKKLVLNLQ
ncbi:MAG: hypothetical protein RIR48_3310 [Bacteroidota bacterium]